MATNNFVRKTPAEKKKEIQDRMSEALLNVKEFTQDKNEIKEFLDFTSQFNKYSSRNIMLLHSQREGSSAVASAKQWKEEHGLYIRKGQKALRILAPVDYTVFNYGDKKVPFSMLPGELQEKAKKGQLDHMKSTQRGYKLVPVFDITQTNAKPEDYPKFYPNRPYNFEFNGEDLSILKESLIKSSESFGVPVKDNQVMNGVERGYYALDKNYIALADNLTETEYIKVLVHEMAHSRLHYVNSEFANATLNQKEVEAEMTAYVVSKHFGLNTDEDSLRYINSWSNHLTENEKEVEILKNITDASHNIIEAAHKEMDYIMKEREKDISHDNSDETKYKLYLHFPDADYIDVVDIYNQFEWLKYSDEVTYHEGTYKLLDNQENTSYKDKSYFEITEKNIYPPEQLKDLKETIEKDINYRHRVNLVFAEENNKHISFTNHNGQLGAFDLSILNDSERQFVKESYEYFKKTGSEFFIDNVTDGQVMDIKEFMALNNEESKMFTNQQVEDYTNEQVLDELKKYKSTGRQSYEDLSEEERRKALTVMKATMSSEEYKNKYPFIEGINNKNVENTIEFDNLDDNYKFLTKHENYNVHLDDNINVVISRKEYEDHISNISPNESNSIKDNIIEIATKKDQSFGELLNRHSKKELTPAQRLTANNTMEMEIE
ncbi:zincin-like metallopeptidase domain-containing protein [Macrococcus armenti]|uniref:zincin-like metallopeptidase domain-containing protein n=1 Tax=Macrococcus armenti TaxID=2875764 RepID=UPI001CCBF9DB|nr:zincin-like metallopeptidase domain-containing protein [Macrococcus armenti]UBH16572.1 ssDNA-binding domain-containing protein [Macrococcus armenti]UBH21207.1 ssDNA-binding domain-containing protein [Macrococcus armenti]